MNYATNGIGPAAATAEPVVTADELEGYAGERLQPPAAAARRTEERMLHDCLQLMDADCNLIVVNLDYRCLRGWAAGGMCGAAHHRIDGWQCRPWPILRGSSGSRGGQRKHWRP